MTNCTHIFEIFVNLVSIMYIFQSFSLKFHSIYLVGKVKSNFCLLTLPFPLLQKKNGNTKRSRFFLSSAGRVPVCSFVCAVHHSYFSMFSFYLWVWIMYYFLANIMPRTLNWYMEQLKLYYLNSFRKREEKVPKSV